MPDSENLDVFIFFCSNGMCSVARRPMPNNTFEMHYGKCRIKHLQVLPL